MKNPNRYTVLLLIWLGTACLWTTGCSKAVEQKNTNLNSAFKPHIRAAGSARQPSSDRSESLPGTQSQYTPADYERLGDISFKRGNLETAFTNYEKALKLSPRNQTVRCKRAWVLVCGKFNSDAAREFEAILAKTENNASAREGLGQAYFQMKRYDRAAEEFKKALALDANRWRARNYLGIIFDHKGQPRQAIEEFRAAIAIKPDNGILYNNLGMAYELSGSYEEAVRAYHRALELDGPREKTLNNLGLALANMGQTEQARAAFMKAGSEEQANKNISRILLTQVPAPKELQHGN